jgi:hypothetical protein
MKLSHAASTTLTATAELRWPIGVGSGALLDSDQGNLSIIAGWVGIVCFFGAIIILFGLGIYYLRLFIKKMRKGNGRNINQNTRNE